MCHSEWAFLKSDKWICIFYGPLNRMLITSPSEILKESGMGMKGEKAVEILLPLLPM